MLYFLTQQTNLPELWSGSSKFISVYYPSTVGSRNKIIDFDHLNLNLSINKHYTIATQQVEGIHSFQRMWDHSRNFKFPVLHLNTLTFPSILEFYFSNLSSVSKLFGNLLMVQECYLQSYK
jgi:phenylalanine-4-hydroxylase